MASVHNGFVLGVDLDGVCGDYTAAFRTACAEELGVAPESLPDERSWDFNEWGLDRLGGFEAMHRKAVLEHRIFLEMPMIEGCAQALWRLSDLGVWIRIVTHRLYVNWGHATAVADTVSWLDRHGIPYRDICFLGAKPEVQADCYVEDSPSNLQALVDAGNDVITFDQPYNQGLPFDRATTWTEVESLVLDRMVAHGRPAQIAFPGVTDGPEHLHRRIAG